ncbi:MAG: long-chain fatty acid--CoA ligase [Atribacterota bacterium]|nr:long-chain fatty acid--CoA ligase [Atribacterota bacterium]
MSLKTLNEMLDQSAEKFKDRSAFKVKKHGQFVPVNYGDFYKNVQELGTGLLELGFSKGDHIGLISENRWEWILSDLAIIGIGAVDVPASGNSYARDMAFKLNHSDSIATILEGEKLLREFSKVSSLLPNIKKLIIIEPVTVFSEEKESPEWAHAVPFKSDENINKAFYKKIHSTVSNDTSLILLSIKAKFFLEKYIKENEQELVKNFSLRDISELQDKLWEKTFIVKQGHLEGFPPIYSFRNILNKGKELLKKGDRRFVNIAKKAKPDDLITIIYTSGTTSDPKGVMLTHRNIMHNVNNLPGAIGDLNERDKFLSVLPSWHIYERTVEYCSISFGASTAYSKPFKQVLLPDLLLEKPTVMCTVPRIWNSLYKGIISKIKSGGGIQQWLFFSGLNVAKKYKHAKRILDNTLPLFDRDSFSQQELEKAKKTVNRLSWQYKLFDKLVFKKIRDMLGGEVKFAISGGGALQEDIDIFLDAVDVCVLEGYGLTETSPVIAGRSQDKPVIFTVGEPIPKLEVKIIDKENLTNEMPHGQAGVVMVKGDLVMKGYYKNEKKTTEVLQDGWFNTGDLGKKTHNGKYLKIIGRIKDTIVLRGGENVEPQPLEDKLKESQYVNMVIVVGQDKPRLGALIIPDFEEIQNYAKKNNIKYRDRQDLISKKEIISIFHKEQKRLISRENGFQPYETVMGIALLFEEFSQEKNEMTESLKLKRFIIHDKYHDIIDKICGKY